jgi:hypothetical protein
MRDKTSLIKIGSTPYMRLTPALVEYLQLEYGENTITIQDREKTKGKYAQFWSTKNDAPKSEKQ